MRFMFFVICLAIWLSGCSAVKDSGLPEGYEGEVATISDTYGLEGMDKAYMFYVKKVDENLVLNASSETDKRARFVAQRPAVFLSKSRRIPARPVELTLVAWNKDMRPLAGLSASNPILEETVTFSPEPGEYYVVKGEATDDVASVWIEDVEGHKVSEVYGQLFERAQKDRVPDSGLSRKQYLFFSLSGGEPAKVVKAKLGEPQSVTQKASSTVTPGEDQVIFHYRGLGEVHFNDYQGYASLRAIYPDQSIEPATIVQHLGVGTALTRRAIAKHLHSEDVSVDTETLDEVARFVWEHRDADGNMEVDAMSWLCKVLGKKGRGRYNGFLAHVASDASSSKLSRYAEASISDDIKGTPFEIKKEGTGLSEG